MPTFAIDGLLFDNDGVLSDSLGLAALGWNRWALEYSPGFDFATSAEHGVPARDLVARLVAPELVAEACAVLERYEIEVSGRTRALPGALALTQSLPPAQWAVVTSATPELARVRLAAAGLQPTVVVTADDVVNGKPHPEPYRAGAAAIGIDPARCVVFEDAPAGVAAARAAGVGVVVGIGDQHLPDATIVVPSLAHVSWADGVLTVDAASVPADPSREA